MDSRRSIQLSNLPVVQDTKGLVQQLEEITGKGTVIACKLRTPKSNKSRMYAYVQFASHELAKLVHGLASKGRIMLGQNKLTAQYLERDIVSKPRSMPTRIEEGKLYMGNLISQNVFSFLWNSGNSVAVEFGFDIRKLSIFLNERYIDYKLELAFRDIRHLHLRNARGSKLLLVQLLNAPKIYYKDESSSSYDMNDRLDFYKDSSDTWVRTTDFTSFFSIGQSSSLCFALPHGSNISQIRENFAHYKEIEERLSLDSGSSFSNTRLVPILSPPVELNVPFEILFQVNSLVQNGLLSGPSLGREFFNLLHPKWVPYTHINSAFVKLCSFRNTCYDPVKEIRKEYENLKKFKNFRRYTDSLYASLDNGLMYVYRVQVTPSKVYFSGPEVNVSNRVTRQYAKYINNFLRVTFIDENGNRLYSTDLSQRIQNGAEKHTKLYKRVLSILKEGIVIGSKKFDFLAFSTSQLRESSVWFFASTGEVNAESIREWMGDFLAIRNVAKCAARMGQSFSSSTETLHVYPHEIKDIPDIWIQREDKKYNFSDGIGKISLSLAKQVAAKCNCDYIPSAFQIRIGGYKGVVAVDPRSPYKLSLRPSMKKYESNNSNLDVLSWTKFRPCFLNRQVITLLSTLGVRDQHFERMQEEVVRYLDQLFSNRTMALEVLRIMHVGDSYNVLFSMLSAGYLPDSEPYLSMILHAFRASKLFELRCKARIFVPKGACLMGCLDESRTLKYGEVFIQVSRTPGMNQFHDTGLYPAQQCSSDPGTSIVEGKVIVAKNPCLHPGDVRVLSAVDNSNLHHMIDCIVFPQQGQRPHPDECSGSDLDGDQYFVSWDESLIPPQQDQPMDYEAKPAEVLDHEVTIEEIQEYFANYMLNDTLGIISNRHTVYADQEPNMARSEICLELAQLFSTAVDFPKTGTPAQIPASLTPKEYPDFMEKEDKPMYESKRIIGKLYRAIRKVATEALFINSFTREVAQKSYDEDLEVWGFENYLDEALMYKNWYDSKLATLMYHYGIKYEAEIVSGNIFSLSKLRGSKFGDLKETIMIEMKVLKKEARSWFDDGENSFDDNKYAKASAWYHVTYHPDYWGYGDYEGKDENNPHFISFPWVIYDKLLRIKREDW
ncbi:probable RNA-dependent RNA polymerase 1 [Cryptomeria japonica]|uniref:probable RNA-dependent RNA polymerase 1 n=1 Tax=Cryptomeria japonica TaxID=3369 RepID=UPI0025AC925B|nr:probable RNA-dependent RNA polymerase 1 [Cryptomeria japonica]XP_057854774.1 probable RNA-dependent RNA polymerase 1 [Cryptomeria japonica]